MSETSNPSSKFLTTQEMRLHHIAIIPARAGSKRLPEKNTLLLGDRPLIGWTIAQALAAGCFDRVMVSTDSGDIRDVALAHGAEVPFLRPPELATDTAASTDVLIDHLRRCGADKFQDETVVSLLQPTSPFRRVTTILRAIDQYGEVPGSSLIGVACPPVPLAWFRRIGPDGMLESPDLTHVGREGSCVISGLLYMTAVGSLMESGNLYGKQPRAFMSDDRIESLDIDTTADWSVATALVVAGVVTLESVLTREL